jgi:outer membrane protein assembly factor BamA
MEVTLPTGLPKSLAVTIAGGTSAGHMPVQRHWFLGGTQTIRGQSADTAQSGNAFWMTRLEVGPDLTPIG